MQDPMGAAAAVPHVTHSVRVHPLQVCLDPVSQLSRKLNPCTRAALQQPSPLPLLDLPLEIDGQAA